MLVSSIAMSPIIEKEFINEQNFEKANHSKEEGSIIKQKLFDAMMLGNSAHHKVHIAFLTDEGTKIVHTTVWATTDNFIILKGGRYIPIQSILAIDLD